MHCPIPEDDPTTPMDQTPPTGKCSDAGAHGFWQHSYTTIFHVHITDTQSCSYQNKDYLKALVVQQENEKMNQYLCLCLEMQKNFTPLVYSDDGITGREAKNVEKFLVYHLLEKWHKPLPQMVCYDWIRMANVVVPTISLLICDSRDWQRPHCPVVLDQHTMHDWQTWLEHRCLLGPFWSSLFLLPSLASCEMCLLCTAPTLSHS